MWKGKMSETGVASVYDLISTKTQNICKQIQKCN